MASGTTFNPSRPPGHALMWRVLACAAAAALVTAALLVGGSGSAAARPNGASKQTIGHTVAKRKCARKHRCKPKPRPIGTSPARFSREAYSYRSVLSPSAEAKRYSVMVMQTTDAAWVRLLHRNRPNLKILVYEDILRTSANDPQVCTNYGQDVGSHTNWFLKNAAGQSLFTPSVPPNEPASYHMDVGVPAYQQACIANSIAVAKAAGFDGIYMDGIDRSITYQFNPFPAPSVPKYPNDQAWDAAITSFLSYARPVVHAHGLLLFGNVGGALPPLWRQWNALMDGGELESYTDDGSGIANSLWWWPRNLIEIAWSEAHGKYVLLHSRNTTEAGNTFGLASMLLVAGGHSSYSTSNANYYADERWYPEYKTALALGAPRGAYKARSNGVYQRLFNNGIVLVNASTKSVRRFRLPGKYSGTRLWHVKSVAMGPTSALIMKSG